MNNRRKIIYDFTRHYFDCDTLLMPSILKCSKKLGCSYTNTKSIYELFVQHHFLYRYYSNFKIFELIKNLDRNFDLSIKENVVIVSSKSFSIAFDRFELTEVVEDFSINNDYNFIDVISWMFLISEYNEGFLQQSICKKYDRLCYIQKYHCRDLNKYLFLFEIIEKGNSLNFFNYDELVC